MGHSIKGFNKVFFQAPGSAPQQQNVTSRAAATAPLVYSARLHGNPEAFRTHADFERFKREYLLLVTRLVGLDQAEQAVAGHPVQSLSVHQRELLMHDAAFFGVALFAPQALYGDHTGTMWSLGKELLATFCDRLEDDSIPIDQRATALMGLRPSLVTCQGGVCTALSDAILAASPPPESLREAAVQAKDRIVRELVTEFVREEVATQSNVEVHVVNAYFDRLRYGTPRSTDLHARSTAIAAINPDLLDDCRYFIKTTFTPKLLAAHLADRYQAELEQALAQSGGPADAKAIEQAEAALRTRYGAVHPSSLMDEDGKLRIEPRLITVDMLDNLHQLGLIESAPSMVIGIQRGPNRSVICQQAGQFWVQDRIPRPGVAATRELLRVRHIRTLKPADLRWARKTGVQPPSWRPAQLLAEAARNSAVDHPERLPRHWRTEVDTHGLSFEDIVFLRDVVKLPFKARLSDQEQLLVALEKTNAAVEQMMLAGNQRRQAVPVEP